MKSFNFLQKMFTTTLYCICIVDEETTISQEQLIEEIFEKMWRFVNVVVQYYSRYTFIGIFFVS